MLPPLGMQREVTLKTVVASLFACAVLAHTPQLLAQASAPQVAAPKAAASVTTAPDATESQDKSKNTSPQPAAPPGGASEPAADADKAEASGAAEPAQESTADEAPAPDKHDIGASRLESQLHKVEAERAGYSRFLPWLTVGVGAALTVGSAAAGAGYVFGCDGDCSTPSWIGIAVATGTLVATLGAIWVVHANADVRELDSKHYQLEQELERIRYSSNLPSKSELQRSQLLSMRFAFR